MRPDIAARFAEACQESMSKSIKHKFADGFLIVLLGLLRQDLEYLFVLPFKARRFHVPTTSRSGPYPALYGLPDTLPAGFENVSDSGIGRTRRAAAVLPCVTRSVPCLPFVQVIASQRSRKHSSGRSPVSDNTAATDAKGSGAAARYLASSSNLTTRSRCFSPGNSFTFGMEPSVPHSAAIFSTRRRTRSELLMLLTCRPSVCRCAAKSAILSPVISSSLQFASAKPMEINKYRAGQLE
jgi:hypothetical protein